MKIGEIYQKLLLYIKKGQAENDNFLIKNHAERKKDMSFTPQFIVTNSITNAPRRIESARDFFDSAKLSETHLDSIRAHAFLLEAHHTTHIDGIKLTLEQSQQILA